MKKMFMLRIMANIAIVLLAISSAFCEKLYVKIVDLVVIATLCIIYNIFQKYGSKNDIIKNVTEDKE